ncbi:FAD-dependent oxidoreductase [Eubacteriales bacterium OttesenSCG-928-A19]|nr:FAD-dependent oxidoreductase [Eubacteriales bacterium OttesenSCG-928-A19]
MYDVLVIGGGPSGVAAAVCAARMGARTALVERYGILGGMLTSGHVQPILGSVAPGTLYDEIIALLGVDEGYDIPVTRNGREVPVDIETAKRALLAFADDNSVEIWLQTPAVEVLREDGRLAGVRVGTQDGIRDLHAHVVVDATGDGFIAARAGAGIDIGRAEDGKCQPATIEYLLTGVDEARALSCFGGSDPVTLPDGRRYTELCKEKSAAGELPENVTVVRLHRTRYPGERNVNATQANGFDVLTREGIVGAELVLREQMRQVTAFLQKNVPGYERCMIKSSASTLGVRESRRVRGLKTVSDADVETGAKKADAVVHNAWFLIDIHNPTGGGQAEKQSKMAKPYDIPYGALVPDGVEGLLVTGRCISGTHRAHASYRVMGICLATGQAAGVAAALCARHGVSPSALDYHFVQEALAAQGVDLFS